MSSITPLLPIYTSAGSPGITPWILSCDGSEERRQRPFDTFYVTTTTRNGIWRGSYDKVARWGKRQGGHNCIPGGEGDPTSGSFTRSPAFAGLLRCREENDRTWGELTARGPRGGV